MKAREPDQKGQRTPRGRPSKKKETKSAAKKEGYFHKSEKSLGRVKKKETKCVRAGNTRQKHMLGAEEIKKKELYRKWGGVRQVTERKEEEEGEKPKKNTALEINGKLVKDRKKVLRRKRGIAVTNPSEQQKEVETNRHPEGTEGG